MVLGMKTILEKLKPYGISCVMGKCYSICRIFLIYGLRFCYHMTYVKVVRYQFHDVGFFHESWYSKATEKRVNAIVISIGA